jgi:thiamine-phosphate pyrophosphorylase
MTFTLPKLYPITDTRLSHLSHAEQVERFAAGGATLIQLREKRASPRQFYEAAVEAMKVARILGVRIIINDRVDIAIAVDADGVHLGQGDLPPEKARALVGEHRIVGYSTHDLKQEPIALRSSLTYFRLMILRLGLASICRTLEA